MAATAPSEATRAARAARRRSRPSLRLRMAGIALPASVGLIVVLASLFSWLPAFGAQRSSDVGGPRLAVAGLSGDTGRTTGGYGSTWAAAGGHDAGALEGGSVAGVPPIDLRRMDPEAAALRIHPVTDAGLHGPFTPDGTLVKPMAVDTSVSDGSALVKRYTVRKGDTLTGIANRFGVSYMSIWWSNNFTSRSDLHVGQVLSVPPVTGVVVRVREGDTLDAIAKAYAVDANKIFEVNGLEDRVLVAGQVLVLPGGVGDPIPTPRATISRPTQPKPGTIKTPATYNGEAFLWPVVGGKNSISQYFRYGHYGLDIAADYGSRVRAAVSGTVIFAGWKNNGGGYQVWLAHGSNLFTTYNHMSAVSVGVGQSVGRGAQVGRVGQSGYATGPHLHFEVWRGPVWDGGTRVNPLIYL